MLYLYKYFFSQKKIFLLNNKISNYTLINPGEQFHPTASNSNPL